MDKNWSVFSVPLELRGLLQFVLLFATRPQPKCERIWRGNKWIFGGPKKIWDITYPNQHGKWDLEPVKFSSRESFWDSRYEVSNKPLKQLLSSTTTSIIIILVTGFMHLFVDLIIDPWLYNTFTTCMSCECQGTKHNFVSSGCMHCK